MRSSLAALAAALLAASGGPARADSLRCDGGIVSEGDATIDLLGKCGRPALREARTDERPAMLAVDPARAYGGGAAERGVLVSGVEVWTYDFGPQRFVMRATLANGRISRIERGSYGYQAPRRADRGVPRSRCDSAAIREGDATLDVLAKCGEPATVETWWDAGGVVLGAAPGVVYGSAPVQHELWAFNFGPQQLVRLVHLVNGIVTKVETGGYGYQE